MPGEDVINVLDPDTLTVEGAVQLDCEGGKGKARELKRYCVVDYKM